MATSPSMSTTITSNATITDKGVSLRSGSISWSIASKDIQDLAATKYNYYHASGWDNQYYWNSRSGTVSFDGLSKSVTIEEEVSVTTRSVCKSDTGDLVTITADEATARQCCDEVPDSAGYIYDYIFDPDYYGTGAYFVYSYNLYVADSTSNVAVSETVDVSGNITIQSTTPDPEPDPDPDPDPEPTPVDPYVTGISMPSSVSVEVGESTSVSYSISIYNPDNVPFSPDVSMSRADSSIASVGSDYGMPSGTIYITGISAGSTSVTVYSGGQSATVSITVTEPEPEPEPEVSKIIMTPSSVSVRVDESTSVSYSLVLYSPDGQQYKPEISISGYKSSIASCSNSINSSHTGGTISITGASVGTTSLTLSAGNKTATLNITVTKALEDPYVTGVSISPSSVSVEVGDSADINYSISVYNPDSVPFSPEASITKESDSSIATSSIIAIAAGSGGKLRVTGVSAGSTSVTLSSGGKSAILDIYVTEPEPPEPENPVVTGLTLSAYSASVTPLESFTIGFSYTLSPDDTSFTPSHDIANTSPSVATVEFLSIDTTNKSGSLKVSALSVGSTTVTFTLGEKTKTLSITVKARDAYVQSVNLDKSSIALKNGETTIVTYTVAIYNPDNVSFTPTITINNLDTSIARCENTVNSGHTGGSLTITGVSAGSTSLAVSADNKSDNLSISVSSNFYIGVDNVARMAKKGYIGINGKAKKVKKIYIGDSNGIAKLFYNNSNT